MPLHPRLCIRAAITFSFSFTVQGARCGVEGLRDRGVTAGTAAAVSVLSRQGAVLRLEGVSALSR